MSEEISEVDVLMFKGFTSLDLATRKSGSKRDNLLYRSLGFYHMASQKLNLSDGEKEEIYGYSSIACCLLEEFSKSFGYQQLTFAINPDNHRAKIAKALSSLLNNEEDIPGDIVSDAVESFEKYYRAQDITSEIYDNDAIDGLFTIVSLDVYLVIAIAYKMWSVGRANKRICDIVLDIPWGIFTESSRTLKKYNKVIQDIHAQVHFLLAMME